MQLDVNTEVYPIKQEERYAVKLTTTLDPDGTPDTAYYTPVSLLFFFFFLMITVYSFT
jgi:DNA-directed RNA polymerase I, II, and III subunit RPABC3